MNIDSSAATGTGVFMPAWLEEKLAKAKARRGNRSEKASSRQQRARQRAESEILSEVASDSQEQAPDGAGSSSSQQTSLQEKLSCAAAGNSSASEADVASASTDPRQPVSVIGKELLRGTRADLAASAAPAAPGAIDAGSAATDLPTAGKSTPPPEEQPRLTEKQLQAIQHKYSRDAHLQQMLRGGGSFTSIERSAGSFSSNRQPPAPPRALRSGMESSSSRATTWNSSGLSTAPVPIASGSHPPSSVYESSECNASLNTSVCGSSVFGSTSSFSKSGSGSNRSTLSRASMLSGRFVHDFPDWSSTCRYHEGCPSSMRSGDSFTSMHSSSISSTVARLPADMSSAAGESPWQQQQPAQLGSTGSAASSSLGAPLGFRASMELPSRGLNTLPCLREESSTQSVQSVGSAGSGIGTNLESGASLHAVHLQDSDGMAGSAQSASSISRWPAGIPVSGEVAQQQSTLTHNVQQQQQQQGKEVHVLQGGSLTSPSPVGASPRSPSSMGASGRIASQTRLEDCRQQQGLADVVAAPSMSPSLQYPGCQTRQEAAALGRQRAIMLAAPLPPPPPPPPPQQQQQAASPVDCMVAAVLNQQQQQQQQQGMLARPFSGSSSAAGSTPSAPTAAIEEARRVASDLAERQVQLQAVQALQEPVAAQQQLPIVQQEGQLQAVQQHSAVQHQGRLQTVQVVQAVQHPQSQEQAAPQLQMQLQALQREQRHITHALQQLQGPAYQQQLQALQAAQSPEPSQAAQQDEDYEDYADFAVDDDIFCMSRGVSANAPQGFGVAAGLPGIPGSSMFLQQPPGVQHAVQQQTLQQLLEQLAISRCPSSSGAQDVRGEVLASPALTAQLPTADSSAGSLHSVAGISSAQQQQLLLQPRLQQQQQQRLAVQSPLQQQQQPPFMMQQQSFLQTEQQQYLMRHSVDGGMSFAGNSSILGHSPAAQMSSSLNRTSQTLARSSMTNIGQGVQYGQYLAGPSVESCSAPVQGNIRSDQLLHVVSNSVSCEVPLGASPHLQQHQLLRFQQQMQQPGVLEVDSEVLGLDQIIQLSRQQLAVDGIAGSSSMGTAMPTAAAWQEPIVAGSSNSAVLQQLSTPDRSGGIDAAQQQHVFDAQQQVQEKLQQLLHVQQIQAEIQQDLMKLLPLV